MGGRFDRNATDDLATWPFLILCAYVKVIRLTAKSQKSSLSSKADNVQFWLISAVFATDVHTWTTTKNQGVREYKESLVFAINKTPIVLGWMTYSGNYSDRRDQIASVSTSRGIKPMNSSHYPRQQ